MCEEGLESGREGAEEMLGGREGGTARATIGGIVDSACVV